MRKLKILATTLAVVVPAAVFGAPALVDSLANYLGGRPTAAALGGTESIGLLQNGATTKLTLNALAAFIGAKVGAYPTDVVLSGTAPIPSGSHQVNAVGGATLTLPTAATVGTTEYVSDYLGTAGSKPITVVASDDAAIVGVTNSYVLSVPFQATGFRRTTAAWQPY